MDEFVYIDESGDLGLKGSKYMVLAALIVKDFKPLNRIVKNMRRHKFRKELKKAGEIKANHSSKEIILYMIEKLNEIHKVQSVKVFFVVFEKRKLFSEYLKNNKHKLYNYVAGRLARNISFSGNSVEIRIDKSKGKIILQEDFNKYFLNSIKPENKNAIKSITHSYSHSWYGLQFADILAWCCFQKFENNNSEYIDKIEIEKDVSYVW